MNPRTSILAAFLELPDRPRSQDSATHAHPRNQEDDDGGRQGGGEETLDVTPVACDPGEGHREVRTEREEERERLPSRFFETECVSQKTRLTLGPFSRTNVTGK